MLFSRRLFAVAVTLCFAVMMTTACADPKVQQANSSDVSTSKSDKEAKGFDELYEAFYGDPEKLPDGSEVKGMGQLLQGATKKFYGDKSRKAKKISTKNKTSRQKGSSNDKVNGSKGFDEMYEAFYGDPDKLPDSSKVKGMGKLLQGATETFYGDKSKSKK
jgi:hypothetical protein